MLKQDIYVFNKLSKGTIFGFDEETKLTYYNSTHTFPPLIKIDLFDKNYFQEIKEDNLFKVGSEVFYRDKIYIITYISVFDKCYSLVNENDEKDTKIVSFENSNLLKRVRYYWFISSKGKPQKDYIKGDYDEVYKYRQSVGNCFFDKSDVYLHEMKIVKKI